MYSLLTLDSCRSRMSDFWEKLSSRRGNQTEGKQRDKRSIFSIRMLATLLDTDEVSCAHNRQS